MLPRQHRANWRSGFVLVSLHLAVLLNLATAAQASTIYTYTGSPFTTFIGSVPAGVTHVSGSFTLAAPLPANFAYASLYVSGIPPLSINFTDGVNTYTSPDVNNEFFVETDASGNISRWDILLGHIVGGQAISILKFSAFFTGDFSRKATPADDTLWEGASRLAGTWGASTSDGGDPPAVPEPASLLLVVSGLIGSAMRGRRSSH